MTFYIVIKNWICTFNIIWNFVIFRATMCWDFIILLKKNKKRLKICGNALSPRDIGKGNSWRSLQSTITEKIAACTFSQDASAMSNENYGIKMTQDRVMMRNFSRMNKSTFCLTSTVTFKRHSFASLKILNRKALLGKCAAVIVNYMIVLW